MPPTLRVFQTLLVLRDELLSPWGLFSSSLTAGNGSQHFFFCSAFRPIALKRFDAWTSL